MLHQLADDVVGRLAAAQPELPPKAAQLAAFEDMFERKRVKSAAERQPDEPPGGA